MAGVAENIQVVSSEKSASVVFDGDMSPTDLTYDLSATDGTSLQELIDSELAQRLGGGLHGEGDALGGGLHSEGVTPPAREGLHLDTDRFIQAERGHTTATLNVFSDTIDLSPDCEPPSPLFPRSPTVPETPEFPVDHSEKSFEVDPESEKSEHKPLSDDSPISEDASDLEPILFFTQTITSDHEQSPLTEVNPFIQDEVVVEPVEDDLPDKIFPPQPPLEPVLVVIEPPDDSTPNSDSPKRISSPQEDIIVEELESDQNLPPETPIVEIEPETNPDEQLIEIDSQNSPLEESLVEINTEKNGPSDTVDASVSVSANNSMLREFDVVPNTPQPPWSGDQQEAEWTTVEEATKEVETEELLDLHNTVSESMTTSTTTKTVKKKKSIEGGDSTSTRVKKTKKTKKSEEKENHISVMTNGHSDSAELQSFESEPQSPVSPVDDDELSNVCVRDLKQTYCREAAKSTCVTIKVPSEEPVPPPVSIRELRRSFCDLKKACDTSEPAPLQTPGNNVQLKSSFSKFDQLQKKSVLHVRSSDASKIQKQLNQETPEAQGANPTCKSCNKTVFVMEQIKAERSIWHKNCFRCKECSKQLTVDTYQSHEGELYCKPHFRELFKPKAVLDNDDEPLRRRKPEMIIRENQPMELPPEVVRASDKADLGLEELSALNVKSRFQVFEKTTTESEVERSPSTVNVKRSPSILSKLAKFQKKGMDVGVTDESLNGVDYEESSSSEDEAQGEEGSVVKASKLPERPMSFNKMEDVKRTWESSSGSTKTKEELRAEHKKEISQIRSRLFQGKQGKMKEMYEQAVADSEKVVSKKDQDIVASEKARLLKERFERGEVTHSDEDEEEKAKNKEAEDMSVFEAGISKKSRSIFLELDATAAKTQTSPLTPPVHALTPRTTERRTSQTVSRQVLEDIVRASDPTDDIVVPTADVSNKFKFFETYKAPEKERKAFRITPPREGQVKENSPDREIYRDPTVVRSEDTVEDETIVKRSQTASKMLSLFRQMEEQKETVPDGPKPLKCFTPPPDYKEDQSDNEDEEEEDESEDEEESEDDGIVKSSDKIEDEFLTQARNAARSKVLKDKFEHWEPEKQSVNNAINLLESEQESIESTKSLRARFESLKADQPKEKPRPKVNRFV